MLKTELLEERWSDARHNDQLAFWIGETNEEENVEGD